MGTHGRANPQNLQTDHHAIGLHYRKTLTVVLRFAIVERMKNNIVTVSSKYQVVIPKKARQKMGLDKTKDRYLQVKSVTKNEIVFRKEPSIDNYLGAFGDVFPANAAQELRKMRDEDRG